MKRFAELFVRLDQTTSTNEKVAAMVDYFRAAPDADAAWAIHFLAGRRLKRLVKRASLRTWLAEESGYPDWLIEESYAAVGDSAEMIALLLPEPDTAALDDTPLHLWVEQRLLPLAKQDEATQRETIVGAWRRLPTTGRLVLNKLITGGFRLGVSKRLVIRALAQYAELDTAVIAHRLMGNWQPDAQLMPRLLDPDTTAVGQSTPYPFFLASPLKDEPDSLGPVDDWQAEWKWDGIRAQLICRGGNVYLWSRGEELLEGRFPEIEQAAQAIPNGTVLDGEILTWRDGAPQGFASLQTRIGRLKPGPTTLKKHPVIFLAYDLLEQDGRDVRPLAQQQRREAMQQLIDSLHMAQNIEPDAAIIRYVPLVEADSWQGLRTQREQSRERGVEGLMLKQRSAAYGVGRTVGPWWKWKVEPYTIDAVLTYAQPGSGRRSNQLTDYTFGIWRGGADKPDQPERADAGELITICKAYSGLNQDEIAELDRWIRQHTTQRFGPVRQVEPVHVFEIAFEGLQASKRHKSGIAFRFPRIVRWRRDLGIQDADTVEQVQDLLEAQP